MIVRNEKPYYYAASIWRNSKKVLRQGTINADDVAEAIDRVYDLAKKVWKRSCVDVTILDLNSGEILGTSSIGDQVMGGQRALPYIVDDQDAADSALAERQGFTPWNEPVIIPDTWRKKEIFIAASIGTYFTPIRFYKIQGM